MCVCVCVCPPSGVASLDLMLGYTSSYNRPCLIIGIASLATSMPAYIHLFMVVVSKVHTINEKRFAGLNFCGFHSF